jgi:hypothetical protein
MEQSILLGRQQAERRILKNAAYTLPDLLVPTENEGKIFDFCQNFAYLYMLTLC